MKIALIAAVFIIIIAVLFLIPLKLTIIYEGNAEKKQAEITLKYIFFRFHIYPKKDKKNKASTDEKKDDKEDFSFEKEKQRIENYIAIFNKIKGDAADILRYAAKRAVIFEKISICVNFGFENAMHTGIFTGILNGFVYSVLAVIHHNSTLQDMHVTIQPIFEKPCFNSCHECIVRIKIVHIIVIAFSVLKIFRKIKKEGRK